ncbi:hypothetical protein ACS0TY_003515 [Phlomoides rotata]
MNDEIWSIIEDGPIVVLKTNTSNDQTTETEQIIPKPRKEWTEDDKRRANLDNIARNTIYHTLDKIVFGKIKQCKTAKEIWKKLEMMCEGTDHIKENKLMIVVQKSENFKMKSGETLENFDSRFIEILNEMELLGKEYSQREKNRKVLRALPPEWDMKVVYMRESKDLSKITTFELFSYLKAFEFDIDKRKDEETSTLKATTLVAAESNPDVESEDDQDELALFIKQFKKFVKGGKSAWKKGQSKPTKGKDSKGSKGSNINGYICYNCRKPVHFIKYCSYPEIKKYSDDERAARVEGKRKKDKERIRALLLELERSKDASPSFSKPLVESEDENSSESEDNEALIYLMAKEEEVHSSSSSSLEKDSPSEMLHSIAWW